METTVFETSIFATALIFIAIGVLVKRFPILIAGYNTMSKEEKEKVDVKGLSSFICYSFVIMGILPLIFYYVCIWLGHADWAGMSQLIPLLYIPYLIIHSQTYDHNKSHKRHITALVSIITIILVAIFMFYGIRPSHVKYENGNISFTGMFGMSKPIREFSNIRISDTIPTITLRLNGISVGGINKGKFKREDGTSCNLYLSSSKAPYIVFTDYSGREIYYNSSSKEKTLLIYRQLEPIFRNEDIKGELKPGADKLTYSAADKALLDSIDHIKGIVKTASGLRYKVVSDGEGTKPSENSNIVIAYRGLHADGSLFWENEKEEFSLKGTIKGFSEGVGLMSVGSKYMLYIPSALGYGSKGIKDLIKPDEPLIYEVTLLEVK